MNHSERPLRRQNRGSPVSLPAIHHKSQVRRQECTPRDHTVTFERKWKVSCRLDILRSRDWNYCSRHTKLWQQRCLESRTPTDHPAENHYLPGQHRQHYGCIQRTLLRKSHPAAPVIYGQCKLLYQSRYDPRHPYHLHCSKSTMPVL